MRRIKYLLWIVIAAILLTFIYQNWAFFTDRKEIGINLYFGEYHSPQLPAGIYYLAVFLIGMLVSYFISLSKRFQNRKTIRTLKEKIAADERRMSEMEVRLAEMPTAGTPETAPETTGTIDVSKS